MSERREARRHGSSNGSFTGSSSRSRTAAREPTCWPSREERHPRRCSVACYTCESGDARELPTHGRTEAFTHRSSTEHPARPADHDGTHRLGLCALRRTGGATRAELEFRTPSTAIHWIALGWPVRRFPSSYALGSVLLLFHPTSKMPH